MEAELFTMWALAPKNLACSAGYMQIKLIFIWMVCTKTRFDEGAQSNSEIAYSHTPFDLVPRLRRLRGAKRAMGTRMVKFRTRSRRGPQNELQTFALFRHSFPFSFVYHHEPAHCLRTEDAFCRLICGLDYEEGSELVFGSTVWIFAFEIER